MKRTKASIRPIYAQLWKCGLCDKKLFSFEAIPTVHSPKQDCLCAKCFVEDNPELAKKIARIVSKKEGQSEEADESLRMAKARRGAIIWMITVTIVLVVLYLKGSGVF